MLKVLVAVGICFCMSGTSFAKGDRVRGQSLTTLCAACHGNDGNSLVGAFPSIAGQSEKYLVKQLKEMKSGVRVAPLMAGTLDKFSDQDFEDVAAYYSFQEAKVGAASKELLPLGEQIYRSGIRRKQVAACSACHSPTGVGNNAAMFPALRGQWPEYTVAQLKAFRAGTRTNDGDGHMMQDTAMDLSDEEIDAVASYIYGLH